MLWKFEISCSAGCAPGPEIKISEPPISIPLPVRIPEDETGCNWAIYWVGNARVSSPAVAEALARTRAEVNLPPE